MIFNKSRCCHVDYACRRDECRQDCSRAPLARNLKSRVLRIAGIGGGPPGRGVIFCLRCNFMMKMTAAEHPDLGHIHLHREITRYKYTPTPFFCVTLVVDGV